MSHPQPNYHAAGDQATGRQALRHLSSSLVVLAAAAFVGGVAAGYIAYLHRSPTLHKHIPGASAWPQQLVVAGLAGAAFGYAYWRHHRMPGRRGAPPWLLSPLGKPAARRLAATIRGGLSGPSPFGRAVLVLALGGLFLYGLYRAGEQVTAGLDPNFTVNAWGGPTYLGAMACHYLDLLVLMGAAAWMLHLILLPGLRRGKRHRWASPTSRAPGSDEGSSSPLTAAYPGAPETTRENQPPCGLPR